MTILVSIDTESGVMRRYDTRMRGAEVGWCRYKCEDVDWEAARAARKDAGVVRDFFYNPSGRDEISYYRPQS